MWSLAAVEDHRRASCSNAGALPPPSRGSTIHFTLADWLDVAQTRTDDPHTLLRTGSTLHVQRNTQSTSVWRHNSSICALGTACDHSSTITPHYTTIIISLSSPVGSDDAPMHTQPSQNTRAPCTSTLHAHLASAWRSRSC